MHAERTLSSSETALFEGFVETIAIYPRNFAVSDTIEAVPSLCKEQTVA